MIRVVLAAIRTVLGKELRENLRDFHVLAYSLAFPMFFYPALIWGVFQIAGLQQGRAEREPGRVDADGPAAAVAAVLAEPGDDESAAVRLEPAEGGIDGLLGGELDAVVRIAEDGETLAATVDYVSTRPRSARASRVVEKRLGELRGERLEQLAEARGIPADDLLRWGVERDDRAPPVALLSFVLSLLLPAQLALIMLIAALYPAVDVVVGERERSTLETTMVAAVPRLAVMAGKVLAVAAIVAVALAGNVLALTLTVLHTAYSLGVVEEVTLDLRTADLLLSLPALAATVLLVGAVMVLGVLPARTFKQGELAGTMVAMVAFVPTIVGIMPDAELGIVMALIPLTNCVLVGREAIAGRLDVLPAILAAGVNGTLGVLALAAAGRLARSEAFLFGGRLPRWLRWLERRDDRS
jgi:sodium transport system permease protein